MSRLSKEQQDLGASLRSRRLLLDVQELVEKPYPNITFHTHNDDLSEACLILTPSGYKPLHLTVSIPLDYPLGPPLVRMDSKVVHPNVYDDYICATILRQTEDYTPAYTLKGIAIQLLSFFSSDSIEQEDDEYEQQLGTYKNRDPSWADTYRCRYCLFGNPSWKADRAMNSPRPYYDALVGRPPPTLTLGELLNQPAGSTSKATCEIDRLPNELLLQILDLLDFEQLTKFAAAWPRISSIIRDFDIVRQRDLQCFCLKKNYHSVKLGVGVSIEKGNISSEFDFISGEAYQCWGIRQSINSIPFRYWLPLPISHPHWRRVKVNAQSSLTKMQPEIKNAGPFGVAQVLFTFMNDVIVRLNQVNEDRGGNYRSFKSNLRHASEKAIDSYFHLFHLLVCLATEDNSLVQHANSLLGNFIKGKQSKADCPNLGHLLIALLISDVEVTEGLIKAIIQEAITRNVVWLFDKKGSNKRELSFMEKDPISLYRLDNTFRGSRTSYRLLMFSELFRRTARPSHQKSLIQVRDELFDRHGAPPRNAAQELAETVRRLHTINEFPSFLREMGIQNVPNAATFTELLRKTVHSSMEKGYSVWGMGREDALLLRVQLDPKVELDEGDAQYVRANQSRYFSPTVRSFFPENSTREWRGNRGSRGGSRGGGRGGARGRGRGGRGRGW
ncbi:hypothetical protein GGS26DRAFT_571821 [Hypomontagnella submonticulosa]|nr:hypothetical protein GGS26DRAFT_571821 [Hypomontagnella submonticulosa]